MGKKRTLARTALAGGMLLSGFMALSDAAQADDYTAWRDIETKYIFGFTTGSGIGLEGEKEFTIDSISRFG
jgi:hypothetical protein